MFAELYGFLYANEIVPKISDTFYQMKFTWSEKLEKLQSIENCPEIEGLKGVSEEEGEIESIEVQSIDIEVNLREIVDENEE